MLGNKMQSLADFASHLIQVSDRRGQTPVIVLDRRLSIGKDFISEFLSQLAAIAERNVRIEIITSAPKSVLSLSGLRNQRLKKLLERSLDPQHQRVLTVETRLVLSRPAGPSRPLVIGFCGSVELVPAWGRLVELTSMPTETTQFQVIGI
jgi:hypothetical protein